jgi:hypothetical protein
MHNFHKPWSKSQEGNYRDKQKYFPSLVTLKFCFDCFFLASCGEDENLFAVQADIGHDK